METLIILVLSSIYVTISYFGLLLNSIKKRYIFTFFIYYIFLLIVTDHYLGQVGNFLVVFGACFLAYYGGNRSLLHVILSLTGYLMGVLTNHLFSIPLSFLGISLPDIATDFSKHIMFLLSVTIVSALLLYLLNRFYIRPRLFVLQSCPPKLLRIFLLDLLIGIGLLTINMVYGEFAQYPPHVLTMNGILISLLSLSSVLLFYSLYELLLRNQQLALQKKEQTVMEEYTKQMEQLYEEMRTFRHDYKNILTTMQTYIDTRDFDNLDTYFHERILPTSDVLPGKDFIIGRLGLIHVLPIKSLLCSKLILCQNNHIPFTIEISAPIDNFYLDSLKLSTILGILLDNAISAAMECEQPKLELALLTGKDEVSIGIRNTTLPLAVPVSRLYDRGYTSKEGHSGLGLATVKKLIASTENANFSIKQHENLFFAKLQLWKEETYDIDTDL